jgi:hypothetical protein
MIRVCLLQGHSDVPDSDVGRFVFEDLAVANEASSSSIQDVRQTGERWHWAIGPSTPSCCCFTSTCSLQRFQVSPMKAVLVKQQRLLANMALLRLCY